MDVRTGRRASYGALLIAFAALCLPAAALGGTASVADGVLTYTGDSVADDIKITLSNGTYVVDAVSTPAPAAGAGCQLAGGAARCSASGITSFAINLGDGADKFSNITFAPAVVDAGGANDNVVSGFAADQVYGGEGNDILNGSWGDDTFVGEPGGDVVYGDLGADRIDYSARTAPVSITAGAGADDGTSGEGDNVSLVDTIVGGTAGDILTGSGLNERLEGGPGPDALTGGGGDDMLLGGAGADQFDGGSGDDGLFAADGEVDSGTCGADADVFEADSTDALDATCEGWAPGVVVGTGGAPDPDGVDLPDNGNGNGNGTGLPGGVAGGGTVFEVPLAVSLGAAKASFHVARGTVAIALACAPGAEGGCTGTVTLFLPGTAKARKEAVGTARRRPARRARKASKIGRRRFKLAPGKEAAVPVRLSRRGRRALGSRRRTNVQASITMNTPTGKRTSTRTIVVERRVARRTRKR